MEKTKLTSQVFFFLALSLYCACTVGAQISIGFVAPDEDPRYANLLLGLREGLIAAGIPAGDVTIIEHRIRRGDSVAARSAAESLRAAGARTAFVVGTELTESMRSVTKELPIIFITPGDPVRPGLASSLARPGNNLTGMTFEFPELSGKRLEMLKEINPGARLVGVVYDPRDSSPRQGFAAASDAAGRLGIMLVKFEIESFRDPNVATRMAKLDGLILIPGGAITTVAESAMRLASKLRIASVVWSRSGATQDAVLSYGVSDVGIARDAARLVVRVIKGHPAGDLPIERPVTFELVVNMKTAKALGITIPPPIMVRTDRVIQ